MKLVFTGAGGGHFYPLIAVAESVRKEVFVQKLVNPDLYFLSDASYDERALFEIGMKFIKIPAGKLRLYPSLENIAGIFKTFWGILVAVKVLYKIYPDVVFAKGGYASFPVLFAARILSIPVVIHESDTVAGRTTSWAGKFAERIAVSYKEATYFFPKERLAYTGQPIRDKILPKEDFIRTFPADKKRPVLFILGGSQGAVRLNETIIQTLPILLENFDIIHQTGANNIENVKMLTESLLTGHKFKDHYFVDGFVDVSVFYPKVDLVITRAGSSLFEIALWQLPSIVIPIPETISRDQRSNAYAFAKMGLSSVVEENNLTPNILISEIVRIFSNKEVYESMMNKGKNFQLSRNASNVIAREIVGLALSHLNVE